MNALSMPAIRSRRLGRVATYALPLAIAALAAGTAYAGADTTFTPALTKFTDFLEGSGGKIITVLSLAGGLIGLASGRFTLAQIAVPVGVGGMQFVAFEARDPVADVAEARRNPFLSRDDMRAVLARSLALYQGRNGGNLPKRMVIHKTTAFKEAEIGGAFDALAGVAEIECVEVSSASCWRGVWLIKSGVEKPPSKPSGFPVPRGTMVVRSGNSALAWVAGNAPDVSTKGDYYQGKKSILRPLQLIRHAGSEPLELTAHEALALTKMDWNNDALYDPVPVSIRYSQKLARTIANVPDLPRNVYPYRLFM